MTFYTRGGSSLPPRAIVACNRGVAEEIVMDARNSEKWPRRTSYTWPEGGRHRHLNFQFSMSKVSGRDGCALQSGGLGTGTKQSGIGKIWRLSRIRHPTRVGIWSGHNARIGYSLSASFSAALSAGLPGTQPVGRVCGSGAMPRVRMSDRTIEPPMSTTVIRSASSVGTNLPP